MKGFSQHQGVSPMKATAKQDNSGPGGKFAPKPKKEEEPGGKFATKPTFEEIHGMTEEEFNKGNEKDDRNKLAEYNARQAAKKKGAPKLDEGGGQGGKKTKYKNTTTYKNDDNTTAETNTSKKNLVQKIFGGKTNKTTTTSRGSEDVDFTRSSETNRKDRKGRTRKKVTVGPKGKTTVTRYKKDGTVKSAKVKKGTHKVKGNRGAEKDAIRTADAKSNNVYTGD